MTIFGFTGTRKHPSGLQANYVDSVLRNPDNGIKAVHHGACIGSDAMAHEFAIKADLSIIIHPPLNTSFMMDLDQMFDTWNAAKRVTILPAKPYLDRDRDIVRCSDVIIATPDNHIEKGGTWYTIKYAVGCGVPVFICHRDGTIEKR